AGAQVRGVDCNEMPAVYIFALSLHDALPILDPDANVRALAAERMAAMPGDNAVTWLVDALQDPSPQVRDAAIRALAPAARDPGADRKSTRLHSSHSQISYAVSSLNKKTPHRI